MADYSKMTTDDFDRILNKKVAEYGIAWLMSLPGVYEIISEELNNDILATWGEENSEEEGEEEE